MQWARSAHQSRNRRLLETRTGESTCMGKAQVSREAARTATSAGLAAFAEIRSSFSESLLEILPRLTLHDGISCIRTMFTPILHRERRRFEELCPDDHVTLKRTISTYTCPCITYLLFGFFSQYKSIRPGCQGRTQNSRRFHHSKIYLELRELISP